MKPHPLPEYYCSADTHSAIWCGYLRAASLSAATRALLAKVRARARSRGDKKPIVHGWAVTKVGP